MLAVLEVPMICFAVAPEWTPRAVERVKRSVARDWRRTCVTGLGVLGLLLVIRGVIELVS
jgi:hypothetical protein